MTIRGCAYAGSKGVVWGPVKDMVHISHGPVGCGQYSWSQRRNYYIGTTGVDTFVTMQFTSDFQEKDIVFGGDKKLEKIIDEINALFPLANGISIQSECPIGLIGDDIEAVRARRRTRKSARPSCRCAAKASAACRSRSATTSPTTRSATGCSTRRRASELRGHALRRQRHRRLQHRRRRLGLAHPARRDGPARGRQLVRRRDAGRDRARAEGQAQPHPLLPVDELHLPAHGREVRRRLDGIQLLRPVADRGVSLREIAAQFDDDDQGQGRGGHRQVPAAGRCASSPSTSRASKARR